MAKDQSSRFAPDRLNYKTRPLVALKWKDRGQYLARLVFGGLRYRLSSPSEQLLGTPLFIVSAGRSGTTLMRSILAAGGEIAIPPESQVIRKVIRRFVTLQHLNWQDLCRIVIAYFESHPDFHLWETNLAPVYQKAFSLKGGKRSLAGIVDLVYREYVKLHFPGARTWGDQSPLNTFFLPRIHATFPQARFLHMLRDGRDAIASLYQRGRTVEEATTRWIASIEKTNRLKAKLENDQYLEIRYEDLVRQPEVSVEKACRFADLQYQNEMLEYWKAPTTVEAEHFDFHKNLAKPIFTSSIGKWRERLSTEQKAYVLERVSPWLQELRYEEAD